MDQNQVIFQTINDIDEFVAKFSDKLDTETVDKIHIYKDEIKNNLDLGQIDLSKDFCVKAIWFMQEFEINMINKEQEIEEKNLLSDLMSQTTSVASNSAIKDGKIIENNSIWFKNIYYKYFYKWEYLDVDTDDSIFVYNIIDDAYQLLLLSAIVAIIFFVIHVYIFQILSIYYDIYVISWFALAIWLCRITKTSSNLSIIIDLFILWCFTFGFWFVKLFFALW